jgi:exopolysaccharide biosynthesis protein
MAVGVNPPGSVMFLITVEGRTPASVGLRLKELATLMLHHGIYSAVNFDGGGSAFMWTKQGGLVADSCYGDGTLQGLRPDHYAIAVF